MAIFSAKEMKRRVQALQGALSGRKIDAVVLHSSDNVYYISGVPLLSEWGRPMAAVLSQGGDATLIAAKLEEQNARRLSWIEDLRPYKDEQRVLVSVLQSIVQFLNEHRLENGTIGLEQRGIPLGYFQGLETGLPRANFVDITDEVENLRLVKSPEELDVLRLGAQIAKIGGNAFLEALHENTTELEVASYAVREMNRALAALSPEAHSSAMSYCHSGEHTLTPHLHPTGRRIRRGDIVALNVFPIIWGYVMELERTFVFGEPTLPQRRALDAVNEAFEAGKAAVRPGERLATIDQLTRDILEGRGYAPHIWHGAGHAHGIIIGSAGREEKGELRIYSSETLRPGMINSIEPGVYIPELGGFRHSDVLIVTEDGHEDISQFPRDIVYSGA
jgi:Xaa-Pro aminopeptidase